MRKLADLAPMTLLAVIAAGGSFGHISELARRSGQHGPMAWAVAICIDLACVVAASEVRRDRRAGRSSAAPCITLVAGIILSLLANVATSQPGAWNRVLAAVPCAAFVAAVGLLERRAAMARPKRKAAQKAPETVVLRPVGDDMARALAAARRHQQSTGRAITRDALKSELKISSNEASELLREVRTAVA